MFCIKNAYLCAKLEATDFATNVANLVAKLQKISVITGVIP